MVGKPSYKINHQIKSPELRVIDEKGEQLGVMDTSAALKLALERELDLVEVAPGAQPPVAKILDFKKWLFQREKEEKKQQRSELKELRIRPNIGDNDLEIRARRAEDFLGNGDKVKLTVVLRGRERAHPDVGLAKLNRLIDLLKEEGKPEKDPVVTGNGYEATLIPIKKHG